MKILIAGSHGVVGSAVTRHLVENGHEVVRLVRHAPAPGEVWWNPDAGEIDTAGLDDEFAANKIEKTAQEKSFAILEKADLVLVVLDNSRPKNALGKKLLKKIADKKIITILNKCDLSAKFDPAELPEALADTIKISAKAGTGIENLLKKIRRLSDAADFDLQSPVCFTDRQKNLLQKLTSAKTKKLARQIISGLLNARLCV